ncbi:MAG TPA: F0F1 ATP synthase subunit delta [Candidatus Binatia bacterium]|nr:F0F1 ATP synthase subunit delta [Candidatus Binatia bacterium]
MSKISRRALARYAADQLIAGRSAKLVAKQLSAQLIESGQAAQADLLLGDIAWELEQRQKLSSAQVTSSTPLSPQLEAALKTEIKKATGVEQVLLANTVDKSVIGGLRVETAGRVWDGTVSRKLDQLREAF